MTANPVLTLLRGAHEPLLCSLEDVLDNIAANSSEHIAVSEKRLIFGVCSIGQLFIMIIT